jgi:hypothetical protein
MVYTQERVDVVHGLRAHIGKLLDLGRGILDLLIGEFEPELLDARLDGIPTGQAMPDGHVACETKVLWLENLVSRWVVEDRFGMDASLVRECDITTAELLPICG